MRVQILLGLLALCISLVTSFPVINDVKREAESRTLAFRDTSVVTPKVFIITHV